MDETPKCLNFTRKQLAGIRRMIEEGNEDILPGGTMMQLVEDLELCQSKMATLVEAVSPLLKSELGSMLNVPHAHAVVSHVSCEQIHKMRYAIAAAADGL